MVRVRVTYSPQFQIDSMTSLACVLSNIAASTGETPEHKGASLTRVATVVDVELDSMRVVFGLCLDLVDLFCNKG